MQDYLSLNEFLAIGMLLAIWLAVRGADAETGPHDD
jgi:hypothetical protein